MDQPQRPKAKPASWSGLRQYRFGILLAALLGMLVYGPLADLFLPRFAPAVTQVALVIIFGWMTISAVYAVSDRQHAPWVALLLGIPVLAADVADIALLRTDTHLLSHVLSTLFLSFIVFELLRYIFRSERVDTNVVFASLCIYLLLGIIWAFIYSLIEFLQPGSFHNSVVEGERIRFGTKGTPVSLYFSFVTMTTLGYGDITPVSAAARALATLQAVCGQLYLTVLVAWLVGTHIVHSRSSDNRPPGPRD